MSESGTPERAFAPASFVTGPNGEPLIVPVPATEEDHLGEPREPGEPASATTGEVAGEAAGGGLIAAEADGVAAGVVPGTVGMNAEATAAYAAYAETEGDPVAVAPGDPSDPEVGATSDTPDDSDDSAGAEDPDPDPEEADEDADDSEGDDEDDEEDERASRFAEIVEERLQRARYAHPLTRAVFTPDELVVSAAVERRAAVWVPVTTVGATVVSAVAAVVLASRLRSDPTDPTGSQLVVVTVTVCLLAAAFGTLLRSEVHYDRLRPRGRTVRTDVADAYETVRDAPRRLVEADAPAQVLVRVVNLLPVAEQLVDAIVHYTREGGIRVKAHPAYERIVRMRAEVEALEQLLGELETRENSTTRVVGVDGAPLPKPEHVASYRGLSDIADAIESGQ